MLSKAKFEVVTANNGFMGINKAQTEQPNLIILDVNMPTMSGFEVKKALEKKDLTRNIPVVFLTALSDNKHTLDGLNLAEDYITKPFNPEILVARLGAVLRRTALSYNLRLQNFCSPLPLDDLRQFGQTIESHEYGSNGHNERVMTWFTVVAQLFGINGKDLENGKIGAQLHDIGKLAIPEEILNKPGPLNEEEWEIMHKHPVLGYEMLLPIQRYEPALDIVRYHHERWDGRGYPDRLQVESIPRVARIFSIIDVYDALISKRTYKLAMSENEALEIIQSQRGTQFDPAITDYFLSNIDFLKKEVHHEFIKNNSSY